MPMQMKLLALLVALTCVGCCGAMPEEAPIVWTCVSPYCKEADKCREELHWVNTKGHHHVFHEECWRYLNECWNNPAQWTQWGQTETAPPHIRVLDEGYLGSAYECDCGYIPAISHSSKDDCIRSLKMRLAECRAIPSTNQ